MAVTAGAVMLLFLWGAVALAAILNGDKLPAAQTSSVAGNTLSTGKTTAATTEKVTRPTTAPTLPSAVRPEGTTAPPKADNAYFDDAVFIGDSRTEGLMLYGGLSNAAFYTHKGLMVNTIFTKEAVKDGDQKITIMKALEKHKFRKVYVMLGVNELGWVYEQVFIQRYGELVDELKRLQPDAVIYIQSIMPVSPVQVAERQGVQQRKDPAVQLPDRGDVPGKGRAVSQRFRSGAGRKRRAARRGDDGRNPSQAGLLRQMAGLSEKPYGVMQNRV